MRQKRRRVLRAANTTVAKGPPGKRAMRKIKKRYLATADTAPSRRAQRFTDASLRRVKAASELYEQARSRYRPPARTIIGTPPSVPRFAHADWWRRQQIRRKRQSAGPVIKQARERIDRRGPIERLRALFGLGGYRTKPTAMADDVK